jgi:two-component system response regulator
MSPTPRSAPIDVLLVEDNPDDAALAIRALAKAKIRNRVYVAPDGADALDYLHRRGPHTEAPQPDLILLDLNLPRIDGRAVLEEIKRDERLRHIPVVVVTGSQDEEDMARSYQLHVHAYVTKPINPVQFLTAVNGIEQFWLEIVKLP